MELDKRLNEIVSSALQARVFPGVVLRIDQEGEPLIEIVAGHRQAEPVEEMMSGDTIFDLASVTKPLATALLTLMLFERRGLSLDVPIGELLPEVSERTGAVPVRNFLLHTSGLPSVPGIYTTLGRPVQDPEAGRRILFGLEPEVPPGRQVLYSCTGYLMLGELLRRQTGRTIGDIYREWVTEPAGIGDLLFSPPASVRDRVAPTENCRFRGRWIRGEVHDENSWCLGGQAGNAGLFGAAAAVSRLLTLFENGGTIGDARLLTPESLELMMHCATPGLNDRRSIGFITGWENCPAGPSAPSSSFGHTGFTGTSVWVLPEQAITIVTLTNRVHFGRVETAESIKAFRRELHTEIFRYFGV